MSRNSRVQSGRRQAVKCRHPGSIISQIQHLLSRGKCIFREANKLIRGGSFALLQCTAHGARVDRSGWMKQEELQR